MKKAKISHKCKCSNINGIMPTVHVLDTLEDIKKEIAVKEKELVAIKRIGREISFEIRELREIGRGLGGEI